MSRQAPLISVVISSLNRQELLQQTARWFLHEETFRDFELIVVDQTAASAKSIIELAAADARLRYFHVDFEGMTQGRNFGVQKAQADLIIFSEDDVIPCDNYLSIYWQHFLDPNVYGATGAVLAPGQSLQGREQFTRSELEQIERGSRSCFQTAFPHPALYGAGGNSAYRRKSIFDIGGFDEEYNGNAWGEDGEFAFRFRSRVGPIDYLPAASVVHLSHSTGGSRTLQSRKYVRNRCRNWVYTLRRTNASLYELSLELWLLIRLFVVNKAALKRPRPHWLIDVVLGCMDGIRSSRLPRKLPLTLDSYSNDNS